MSWSLYQELLSQIDDRKVTEGAVFPVWSYIKTEDNAGLAMTPPEIPHQTCLAGKLVGMPLSELACHVMSWDTQEATIATAGVNAFYNNSERLPSFGDCWVNTPDAPDTIEWIERMGFEKVAFIGHYPVLDNYQGSCKFTILEKQPQPGDLPDMACDFVLPDQDAVFITGATFPNKTIVHLLDICRSANVFTALWGPTVPLSPVLFDYGVQAVFGTVVREPDAARAILEQGSCIMKASDHLQRVLLSNDPYARAAMVKPRAEGVTGHLF